MLQSGERPLRSAEPPLQSGYHLPPGSAAYPLRSAESPSQSGTPLPSVALTTD